MASISNRLFKNGMQMDRLNWDDVRLFLALARAGTLTGAARQLGLGVATVSRRIDRLEQVMAVPLFLRHQQGMDLTDQGQALLPRAEAAELAMTELRRDAQDQAEIRGLVRLASIEALVSPVLLPALTPLLAVNPGLDVEISYSATTVNLHRHAADMALRLVAPEAGNLKVQRLGTLGYGLYGPAEGQPRRQVTWPELDTFQRPLAWSRAFGGEGRLMVNTLEAQVAAVREGIGVGILPHFHARRAGLRELASTLPDGATMETPLLLVTHADLANSRRLRAVAEAVTDGIGRMAVELRGVVQP
ncbi:LysR family transcriptional regulator [Alloyangia pacifica]|uniref:LysR family transcriptional regulator n=1 Tax=Alloyangia pacifica TaxID=311180 RepID=UPI001CD6796F|nr:LysR family transcriptional regulator [Alloyangia pacifica]MCA0998118.1 LysR family transcriptional regulator [Alloyangia pacifica]